MLVIDFDQLCKVARCAHTQTSGGADDTGALRGRGSAMGTGCCWCQEEEPFVWSKKREKGTMVDIYGVRTMRRTASKQFISFSSHNKSRFTDEDAEA